MQGPKEVVEGYLGHKMPFFESSFSPDFENIEATLDGWYLHLQDKETSNFTFIYGHGNLLLILDEVKKGEHSGLYKFSFYDTSKEQLIFMRTFKGNKSAMRAKAAEYMRDVSHTISDNDFNSIEDVFSDIDGFDINEEGFDLRVPDEKLHFLFNYFPISYDARAMGDIKHSGRFKQAFRYIRLNGYNPLERDLLYQLVAKSKKDFWKNEKANEQWPCY